MLCDIFKDDEGRTRVRWRCTVCGHHWDFHASAVEDIGFFVVHHLLGKHQMSKDELLAYDHQLDDALREYSGLTSSGRRRG